MKGSTVQYITSPPPPPSREIHPQHRLRLCIALQSTLLFLASLVQLFTHALTGLCPEAIHSPPVARESTTAVVSTSTMMPAQQQHRGSHAATTTQPKIKIIHIVAPEVIKTDAANFRDLVQRLTGKPAAAAGGAGGSVDTTSPPALLVEEGKESTAVVKKRPPSPPIEAPVAVNAERAGFLARQEPISKKRRVEREVKVEDVGGFAEYDGLDCNDLWMDLNPGGFLSFLEEELDVFQGLVAADHDDFLPLLPLGGPARMDLLGEMYAS